MMDTKVWVQIIFDAPSVSEGWKAIFGRLAELALSSSSPVELHNHTIAPDRLLAESAWELWTAYQSEAPKTADALKRWCPEPSPAGRAVLVLDAFSLRELPLLLGGAEDRGIKPVDVRVTGSEVSWDGFWKFVDRLRQGHKLVITADHGYAVSRLFSSEEMDPDVIETLRSTFGASRYKKPGEPWHNRFMPPLVTTENGYHVIMGQRKWKVQGGFPHITHGGLSLLEVAVPFVELPLL